MLLAVRLSSYGCTCDVWRALQLKRLNRVALDCASRNSYASIVLSKTSRVPIWIYMHARLSMNQFFYCGKIYLTQSRYTNRTETKQKKWQKKDERYTGLWFVTFYNITERFCQETLTIVSWFGSVQTVRQSLISLTVMRFSGSWRLWRG